MTSNTYTYILADELCEWLLDESRDKKPYKELVSGLSKLGIGLMYECLFSVDEADMGFTSSNGMSYSRLSPSELEKITHEVCDRF